MPAYLFWSLYMNAAYMGLTSCSWSCLYSFTTEGCQTSNLHITHKQILWSSKPKPNWKRTDNHTLYICDIMLYNVECIRELINVLWFFWLCLTKTNLSLTDIQEHMVLEVLWIILCIAKFIVMDATSTYLVVINDECLNEWIGRKQINLLALMDYQKRKRT